MKPLDDEQAEAVADVIRNADGGCGHCVRVLADHLSDIWPERDWLALARAIDEREWAAWKAEREAKGLPTIKSTWP